MTAEVQRPRFDVISRGKQDGPPSDLRSAVPSTVINLTDAVDFSSHRGTRRRRPLSKTVALGAVTFVALGGIAFPDTAKSSSPTDQSSANSNFSSPNRQEGGIAGGQLPLTNEQQKSASPSATSIPVEILPSTTPEQESPAPITHMVKVDSQTKTMKDVSKKSLGEYAKAVPEVTTILTALNTKINDESHLITDPNNLVPGTEVKVLNVDYYWTLLRAKAFPKSDLELDKVLEKAAQTQTMTPEDIDSVFSLLNYRSLHTIPTDEERIKVEIKLLGVSVPAKNIR